MPTEKQKKNLKPFSKENQPEGRGRPKGSHSRATILKKFLAVSYEFISPLTRTKQKGTVEEHYVLALIGKATRGDIAAIKEIQDTVYGKITDKLEHSGADGGPIPITIIEPVKPDA